jgi:hypothetical protein
MLKLWYLDQGFCFRSNAPNPFDYIGISSTQVKRNFYWIWFVGAAVWFFDAALSLHYDALYWGLLEAAISAGFLAMGMYLKKQSSKK